MTVIKSYNKSSRSFQKLHSTGCNASDPFSLWRNVIYEFGEFQLIGSIQFTLHQICRQFMNGLRVTIAIRNSSYLCPFSNTQGMDG